MAGSRQDARKRPLKAATRPARAKRTATRAESTPRAAAPSRAKAPKALPRDAAPLDVRLRDALAGLRALATPKDLANLARFGIASANPLGVSMASMQGLMKRLGKDHDLALALWDTGIYEARVLATLVDEPALVTPAQMERWCKEFDSWAVCDTACFKLFDRTPHAWAKVDAWARREPEFERRAAYALLASVASHTEDPDEAFLARLPLAEEAALDERNFVKKGVSWALRSIAQRGPALREAVTAVAERLAASKERAPRWVGKDVLREIRAKDGR